jgi:hypothetical protein
MIVSTNPKPLNIESIDDRIETKRAEIRELERTEDVLRADLYALFQQKAEAMCPIPKGARIEYSPARFGRVDRIGFFVGFTSDIDAGAQINWTVSGRKINKIGKLGLKRFPAIGPASHTITEPVNGTRFTHKDMGQFWSLGRKT